MNVLTYPDLDIGLEPAEVSSLMQTKNVWKEHNIVAAFILSKDD